MLAKKIYEIVYEDSKVVVVKSEGEPWRTLTWVVSVTHTLTIGTIVHRRCCAPRSPHSTPPTQTKMIMVIGDPSYFPEKKVEQSGSVVRAICILDHPIRDTANAVSCQIIVPGTQAGRKNGEAVPLRATL
jgi:hypothetical protein